MRRIELDLSDARDFEEHKVYGDTLVVESLDGECDVYFNDDLINFIELDKTRKLYMDFWRIHISNSAQAGLSCVLLIGIQGTFDGVSDVARQSTLEALLAGQGIDEVATPSNDLIVSNDSEKSHAENDYYPTKIIYMKRGGVFRVKFDMKTNTAGQSSFGKIYKNGEPYGTERETILDSYTTYSEDLGFAVGDTCEIWGKVEVAGHGVWIENHRLYGESEKGEWGVDQDPF